MDFYGETFGDRLWMWGHHIDSARDCGHFIAKGQEPFDWTGKAVDQAEGCRLMGIRNNCVIRWRNLPRYPFGDYFAQFRSLERFAFGITDGGAESTREKLRIAIEELKPAYPNFTGCFLDDYFLQAEEGSPPDIKELEEISKTLHKHDLRLSVVAYADQVGLKKEFSDHFGLVDEISLWFWHSANIGKIEDECAKLREIAGKGKSILLGLYMWDFPLGAPVPGELMKKQLEAAKRLMDSKAVSGLIFHPSFAANLDAEAIDLAKEWIRENSTRLWGAGSGRN